MSFSIPAPSSGVAVLASFGRSWHGHIPFRLLFNFQGTVRRSFTCSHWEEQNYRVFLKNFLFYKRSLHSFGQRGSKCTPIFEAFEEKFLFGENIPSLIWNYKAKWHPVSQKKMRKYFSVAGALFCLLRKTPSFIPTGNSQMHTQNLKKFFVPSLIWNWEAETHPVFTKILKKFFR